MNVSDAGKKTVEYSINLGPSLTLIFIAFFVMKVMGYITWSWWLVTAPLWIPFAMVAAFLTVLVLVIVMLFVGALLLDKWG